MHSPFLLPAHAFQRWPYNISGHLKRTKTFLMKQCAIFSEVIQQTPGKTFKNYISTNTGESDILPQFFSLRMEPTSASAALIKKSWASFPRDVSAPRDLSRPLIRLFILRLGGSSWECL